MERHAFAMKVKEGKMNDYRKTLGEIWPELTAYLDRNGIHNFSIWNAADLIFGYYENADGEVISPEEEKVKAALTEKIGDTFTWISTPGKDMRLMYHNFGVVRENKELIRHRMFMTKLKDGCEEEYKARHDGLVAQRGETIDRARTATSASGVQADIFLDMMRSTQLWKWKKHRKQERQPSHGRHASSDHGLDHQRCGLDDKRSTSIQCTSCMA